MARKRRAPVDANKAAAEAEYRSTPFTNRPLIQPHEADSAAEDLETAALLGYEGAEAAEYVASQLKMRRLREWSHQRSVQLDRAKQAHLMREKKAATKRDKDIANRASAEATVAQVRREFPQASETWIIDEAAERLGVSPSTVYRWLGK